MNTTDIIGHQRQLEKLSTMIANNKIPQSLLFSGPSGIGKFKIANTFLNTLFCKSRNAPCGSCHKCVTIINRTHPDFIVINPNSKGKIAIGDSVKKEPGSIRWLIERLSKKNITGRIGIIINGTELISTAGQNALLKTIEEPQENTTIILLTSNKSLVLPTILSRCTEISFLPLNNDEINRVASQHKITSPNLAPILAISGGSMEIVQLLSDEQTLNTIIEVSKEISSIVNNNKLAQLDTISSLLKSIGPHKLVNILVNIYRELLLSRLFDKKTDILFEPVVVNDIDKLKRLIKIFLALKKGISNNLNMKISLKGQLYTLNSE